MRDILNHINGTSEPPSAGGFLDNIEPATGKVYGRLAASDANDVDRAAEAALAAFPAWAETDAEERSRILLNIAEAIEGGLEELARAESVDNGKPLALARAVDIPRAARNFRFFATAILHGSDELHETDRRTLNYTLRHPLGVVGCISPWNLPLYLFTWKIAPALAAGNTVLAKPSEVTPATASMLGDLLDEAGLPPGVLNILHGTGPACGAAIVEHPLVQAVSFTGGTATGERIAAAAAPKFKKLSLELGGKNPTIIFDDAHMAVAVETAARAAFTNQGEICLCGSRILVHRSIAERVTAAITDHARSLRVGDPLEEGTDQGALVSAAHREKVHAAAERAIEEGGIITTGGAFATVDTDRCRDGFFYEPTVITDLDHSSRTQQEEIFGPVVTITPFDSDEEAVHMANATPYGLAASIWTTNLDRAHETAARIHAGIVWVNCWMLRDLRTPFGGMKHSGVGREGGVEALRFFTEAKNVCVKLSS